jgi:hypothetical protein
MGVSLGFRLANRGKGSFVTDPVDSFAHAGVAITVSATSAVATPGAAVLIMLIATLRSASS